LDRRPDGLRVHYFHDHLDGLGRRLPLAARVVDENGHRRLRHDARGVFRAAGADAIALELFDAPAHGRHHLGALVALDYVKAPGLAVLGGGRQRARQKHLLDHLPRNGRVLESADAATLSDGFQYVHLTALLYLAHG